MRLALMALVAAGVLAFFIFLTSRLASPEMALLYGELDSQDSGRIASQLDQMKIAYRVSADGTRVFVPAEQIGRLRVAMAEQGLPSGGSIGYEIFDRSEGLGTTSFVQNVNHLRALEGELSRTIRSIAQIQQARVHLVLPERELFSRNQVDPSASIVLTLQGNRTVSRGQVAAIQHLVAAAVQGLRPNDISIVDSSGALLARGAGEEEFDGLASNAEEMRQGYEMRLGRTIEELLEKSVGPGNVRAEVSAEMDFDRVTENAEIYDPDGQVVRSSQTVEESSDSQDGQVAQPVTIGNNLPNADLPDLGEGESSINRESRVEETVNYEISRTVKTHVRESGLVRRLSVAILVNGIVTADENGETQYQARSPEELEQLAALARSTAGYDEARGDSLEIVNMRFADLTESREGTEDIALMGLDQAELMRMAELLVLGLLAVLVLLLVVRPLLTRVLDGRIAPLPAPQNAGLLAEAAGLQTALPGAAETPAIAPPARPMLAAEPNVTDAIENTIDINKVEGKVRASSVKKIGEIVEKHPEEAVAILRNWLYQET